jgi:hypothetical protein
MINFQGISYRLFHCCAFKNSLYSCLMIVMKTFRFIKWRFPSRSSTTKVIGRTVHRNKFLRCLFIFISPLHVSTLAGYHQEEYAIIFGKLSHYSGSIVLCYRSCFVYGLANTDVVYLVCENVRILKCRC